MHTSVVVTVLYVHIPDTALIAVEVNVAPT